MTALQHAHNFINWCTEYQQFDVLLPNGKIDVEFYLLHPFNNYCNENLIDLGTGGFADEICREAQTLLQTM